MRPQQAAYPAELPPPQPQPQVLPQKKSKKARTFPEKLMDTMLTHGHEDVVAWLPDGKSFVVVDPNAFVAQVLDPVFKQAKYSSFVRKLHRWGFVRLTSGIGTDCFHHPFFNRNRRDWASKIAVAAAPAALTPGKAAAAKAAAPPKASPPIQTKNIPSLAGMERFIPRGKAGEADVQPQPAGTESKAKGLSSTGSGEEEEEDVKKPCSSRGASVPSQFLVRSGPRESCGFSPEQQHEAGFRGRHWWDDEWRRRRFVTDKEGGRPGKRVQRSCGCG